MIARFIARARSVETSVAPSSAWKPWQETRSWKEGGIATEAQFAADIRATLTEAFADALGAGTG